MDAPDPIFPARNYFYLGGYRASITEASGLAGLSEDQEVERDYFLYRSYIELGDPERVLAEVDEAETLAPLAAVRLLASYAKFPSDEVADEAAAASVSLAAEGEDGPRASLALAAYAALLARAGRHDDVLAATHGSGDLALLAAQAASLLAIRRVDAAERVRRTMAAADDDDALTHLVGSWTGLALGGARALDAFHAIQELGDRYAWTARLHAILSAAHARAGRWEEAASEAQLARSKDPKDPDAVANAAVVALHEGDRAASARALEELRKLAPTHPILVRADEAAEAFDRAVAVEAAA